MSKLIKALNIFLKYGDLESPIICCHEELVVVMNPALVGEEDTAELEKLGFLANEDGTFSSCSYEAYNVK